jgi:alpha/beta superfamily hydrolase
MKPAPYPWFDPRSTLGRFVFGACVALMAARNLSALAWLLVAGACVGACSANHQLVTSRRTPCRYQDIEISEEQYMAGMETWLASCRGHRYRCSSKAIGTRVNYMCRVEARGSESVSPAKPAP